MWDGNSFTINLLKSYHLSLKHSLPAICRKCKRKERLGLLTKRYQSADKAQKHAQSHRSGETKPRSETSAVSDTEWPDATAKALLREEGKERQEELKALELKGETRENSVLLESRVCYNYVHLIYLFQVVCALCNGLAPFLSALLPLC